MLAQHYVSQYEMKTGLYFPYVILGFIFIWIEKWLLSPKIITNTKPVLKLVKLICGALTQNSSTYLNSKSFDLGGVRVLQYLQYLAIFHWALVKK